MTLPVSLSQPEVHWQPTVAAGISGLRLGLLLGADSDRAWRPQRRAAGRRRCVTVALWQSLQVAAAAAAAGAGPTVPVPGATATDTV